MKEARADGRTTKQLKEKVDHLQRLHSDYVGDGQATRFALEAIQAIFKKLTTAVPMLSYLHRLAEELIESITHESNVDELLLQLNFNYRPYFLFLQDRIRHLVSLEETVAAKLETLALELKKLKQVQTEFGLAYSASYPPLQDVMASWIHEEMSYLETKRVLAGRHQPEDVIRKDFRLGLDLSVAQFACLVHSLIESKVILNTNLSEMAAFFAVTTVTKKSENISEGSFRRKYYNIEDGTRRSVAEMLNRVVEWLIKK